MTHTHIEIDRKREREMKLWMMLMFSLLVIKVKAMDEFMRTKGVQFMLNGSPFYANGFNAYWLMYTAYEPSERSKISSAFEQAKSHGLSVARTWAFNDGGYRALQNSPGSYDEQAFKGLDFVISEARKYGIKLILSMVNEYDNFGGRNQYVAWAKSEGQNLASEDDFFSNSVVKEYYKNHIKTVLTRRNSINGVLYKDDPTIMAWELMNEPRCPSDPSGRTIQSWITEMASYVKSIDNNHLLEVGLEGFYGPSASEKQQFNLDFQVGTDFIANNRIPDIDFATVHSYPDVWFSGASEETQLSFLNNWADAHIQDAQNILKKPIIFAEFGKSGKNSAQRDNLFATVYTAIYASARGGGAASGGLFWQLLIDGMDNLGDGYEVVLSQESSTANLIAQESHKLNRIRKMYVRIRNVEIWKKARRDPSNGENGGN